MGGNKNHIVERWVFFLIGMFLMGTGIALMIQAQIGVSPISAVTTTGNMIYAGFSLGTYSFILNFVMFVGEFIVDPKSFSPSKFIQLVPTVISSVFIDFNMFLLSWVHSDNYIGQLLILVLGCAVLGLSLSFMVDAKVILMPNEAFISVIAEKTHQEWGNIRTYLDIALVIFAAIMGLLAFQKIVNIREGTLISAIIVGQFSRLFTRLFVGKLFAKFAPQDKIKS